MYLILLFHKYAPSAPKRRVCSGWKIPSLSHRFHSMELNVRNSTMSTSNVTWQFTGRRVSSLLKPTAVLVVLFSTTLSRTQSTPVLHRISALKWTRRECGRKRACRNYHNFHERIRYSVITKNFSQYCRRPNQDLNQAPTEHKAEASSAEPPCSIHWTDCSEPSINSQSSSSVSSQQRHFS
jgi:hypothetical protein